MTTSTNSTSPAAECCNDESSLWQISSPDRGVLIIQRQGAADPQPGNWRDILGDLVRTAPSLSMVGPKRVGTGGNVFSMGEFVLHPKGFHHLGLGVPGECYRFPEEVDVIAGGAFAVDQKAFDEVDGAELLQGELGAIALGLALRQIGGRCFAVPQVVLLDPSTPRPDTQQEQAFRERFGFDWNAADLDAVRQRYHGSDLLWNLRLLSTAMPFEKYERRGALVWDSYAKADYFRKRADHLADYAKNLCPEGLLLDLGCGDGLFSHLFAMRGVEVLGVDPEPEGIEQSRKMTASQTYPDKAPRFEVGRGDAIPVEDKTIQTVTLFDVIEHLPNPMKILGEIARVLRPGGRFLAVTPAWQFGASSDPVYHNFEYTMEELIRQINAVDGLTVCDKGSITGVYRDLVVIAGKD